MIRINGSKIAERYSVSIDQIAMATIIRAPHSYTRIHQSMYHFIERLRHLHSPQWQMVIITSRSRGLYFHSSSNKAMK